MAAVDAHLGAGAVPAAEELVGELRSLPPTARADATLAYLAILRGRSEDARVLLTRAWQAAGREGDEELSALIATRWVLHSLARGDGRSIVEWADRVTRHAAAGSAYDREAAAIRGLGLGALGQWREARAHIDAAAADADSSAQSQRVALGQGWLDLLTDDPVGARAALESAASTDFSFGSTRISLWARGWLARALFVLGHWDRCLEVTREAALAVEAGGHDLIRPLVHWPAAVVHANRAEPELARAHLRAGDASDTGRRDYLSMRLPSALAHAQVAEAEADYPAVLRALEPIAATLLESPEVDPGFWPWADVYANALVMTGRHKEAEEVLLPHLAAARERGHRSRIGRGELVLGRLSGARGDIDSALGCFERAREAFATLPMPVEEARLAYATGVTLRRAGRRREADEVLRAARAAYGRLGARSYVARCERELKASGVERSRAAGAGELTPQEAAVVELVVTGRTNKEVAGELYISVKTVQYHLTRVYAKLGVRSRAELTARYTPDPP